MTSILYNRGVNSQAGNPLHDKITRLTNRIVELEKKMTDLLEKGGAVGPTDQGEKGDKGDQGEKGEKGDQGEKGDPVA
jgi:hypothetical protein